MKKSLLIITEAFDIGGVETYIRGEIVELTRQGWEVHLACGKRFSPLLVPSEVASVTSGLELGPHIGIAAFLDTIDRLRMLVRERGVSVIHAHPFSSLVPSIVCAEKESLPLVVTLHGPASVVGSYGAAYDFLNTQLVLPGASKVLAVSQEVADLAAPYIEEGRLQLHWNAVEVDRGPEQASCDRWLLVSRLDESKVGGIIEFVQVAQQAQLSGVDICGDGDSRPMLELGLAQYLRDGFVRLLGVSNDIPALARSYRGVAGMGRVTLEAAVQGVPVCLVGYDGVKGCLDDRLYEVAIRSNLSGRGLPSLDRQEAVACLRAFAGGELAPVNASKVRENHSPARLWSDFAAIAASLEPVEPGPLTSLVRELRAADPHSKDSAYWSLRVMSAMGRVIAAHSSSMPRLASAYSIFSEEFSRSAIIERQSEIRAELSSKIEGVGAALLEQTNRQEIAQRQMTDEWSVRFDSISSRIDALDDTPHKLQHLSERIDALGDMPYKLQRLSERIDALGDMPYKLQRLSERIEAFGDMPHELLRLSDGIGRLSGAVDVASGSLVGQVTQLERQLSAVYSSTSWRLTMPLRFLKTSIVAPRTAARQVMSKLDRLLTSSWGGKMQSASRFLRRSIRTGRIDPVDRVRLRSMLTAPASLLAETEREGEEIDYSGLPLLAEVQGRCADVFVWAVIDWHFRTQRPQHLAIALAKKGHRVFYISNNFADNAASGFNVEALDDSGRLFQVNLNLVGSPQIYHAMPSREQAEDIRSSLSALLGWTRSTRCMSFVQHPYWLEPAQCLPNMQLVYDCMDHHGGFEDNAASILAAERELIERSDLLVVTSQWLHDELKEKARNIAMVRNATEYGHFCERPESAFSDAKRRKVIGYYGAIAEWFDVDLLRKVAQDNPDALVLMIGRDTSNVATQVSGLGNIRFVGEVAYRELPFWLHGFDVCLLPFRVIPLTLATNPVKVYEYLSAGKPVVSVDLPEMAQFEGLVRLASDHDRFLAQVRSALDEQLSGDSAMERDRKEFAARQTWLHRAASLDEAMESIDEPLVSIIVLTYNNLDYTKQCLHSLEVYSDYENIEIIVVDNASVDESPIYLADWASKDSRRIFIANDANLGFSAGNNVGLRMARGEYLVMLNNDTYVTPGWVRTLANHLRRHPEVGLVGPVTNNIGNEAKIDIHYESMEEMIARAGDYTRRNAGKAFPIETAAFFCAMITRQAYEKVGGLDEQFGVGFFEDDDYCRRLEQQGLSKLCAEDVFVHHHLSASFDKLRADKKMELFERNKGLYESKWGKWMPHSYR